MPDTKISGLPVAVTVPVGTIEFGVNDGLASKKLTLDQVWTGPYAPGSFTVPTGYFRMMVGRLELTGTETVTLEGDATLAVW